MDPRKQSTRTRIRSFDQDFARSGGMPRRGKSKKSKKSKKLKKLKGETTYWPLGEPEPHEATAKLRASPWDTTDIRTSEDLRQAEREMVGLGGGMTASQLKASSMDTTDVRAGEDLRQAERGMGGGGMTASQLERLAGEIKRRVVDGELHYGNVELAALLGHRASQLALGRDSSLDVGELIDLLIFDPNVRVDIRTRVPGTSAKFD